MRKLYEKIVNHPKLVILTYVILFIICFIARSFVSVNYDINDYLPQDSPSTQALDVLESEYDGGIPNARVMIYDVTIPQALQYKELLSQVQGVEDVTWLDDVVNIEQPLEMADSDDIETYYNLSSD